MKIAPVITNLFKTPLRTNPVHPVSFKAAPAILKSGLNELDGLINNEITPFMKESRDLYIETGKIGYRAQEAVNFITMKENELFQHKFAVQNPENNLLAPFAGEYLTPLKEYNRNKTDFENIEKMSRLPMYDTPELKEKITAAKEFLSKEENEFEKILPVGDYLENAYKKLGKELDEVGLKSDESLFKKFKNAKEQQLSAQYFIFITPYNDAVKLKLKREDINSSLKNPAISLYTKMENIEKARESAEHITKDKEIFYKNRADMEKFVSENKNALPPSVDEINDGYSKLREKCDGIFEKYAEKAGDFFLNNPENIDFDPEKAQNFLQKQRKINDGLYAVIDRIKADYIAEQNKDFYEKFEV